MGHHGVLGFKNQPGLLKVCKIGIKYGFNRFSKAGSKV